MSKLTKFALAGMMAMALGAWQARADDPKPAPKADKPAAVPLTDESLQTMLENMGYTVKVDKLEKTSIYTVQVEQNTWTYYIDISLSNDKDQLWMVSSLVDYPTDGKVPADMLLRLLEENNNIGPAAVYYDKQYKKIKVGLPLLNHGGVTPAVFRTYFNDYLKDVSSVQELCKFPKTDDKTDVKKPEDTKKDK
jgi:hypothetical protein